MIKHVIDYARKHNLISESGFTAKQIQWAIQCNQTGKFLGIIPLGDVENKKNRGRGFPMCPDLSQAELIGGKTARSHFLADACSTVVLLTKPEESPEEKTKEKHACFKKLLSTAAQAITELCPADLVMSHANLPPICGELAKLKAKPTDKITFCVDGQFILDSDCWHEWWRQYRKSLQAPTNNVGADLDLRKNLCLVTGKYGPVKPTHEKIAGLSDVGGLPTGDVLVGFDKASSQSYGLEQSYNAPMSETAVALYRSGLNNLLGNSLTSQRLIGAKIVHWFKDAIKKEDDPLFWIEEPESVTELQGLMSVAKTVEGVRLGQTEEISTNHFYAMILSGASGRVMVREWIDGSLEQLSANVKNWFADLAIVRRDGDGLASPPKIYSIVACLFPDQRKTNIEMSDSEKQMRRSIFVNFFKSAIKGVPITRSILDRALQRVRVSILEEDESKNHARFAIIKAYHVRKNKNEGGQSMTAYLNQDHPDPAYHCGRLLAVLADIQKSALGDVGAGVVQCYYMAANQTPALILGKLVANAQNHLGKLDGGLAHYFEGVISDIVGKIGDSPPRILDLEHQSLFAIGYYQQKAHRPQK